MPQVYFICRNGPMVEFNSNHVEMREFIYLEGIKKWRKIKQIPVVLSSCPLVSTVPGSPCAPSWRHSHKVKASMLYISCISNYQRSCYLPYCKQISLAFSLSLRNKSPHFCSSSLALQCYSALQGSNRWNLYLKKNGR